MMKSTTPSHQASNQVSAQTLEVSLRRHQKRLLLIGVLALLVTAGIFFFRHYKGQQEQLAQADMFQAVYYFEEGDFKKALQGDGACAGLNDIIQEYPYTKAQNLAYYYAGLSYMHQHEYEKAVQHLKQFKSPQSILQGRAYVVIGDALVAQQQYAEAATYYMKAVDDKPTKAFTPHYLRKAALAYEAAKDYQAAHRCYQRIEQEYPQCEHYREACKQAARVQTLLAKQGRKK